jgi:hypothetical protein
MVLLKGRLGAENDLTFLAFDGMGGGLVALLCSNSFKYLGAPFIRKTVFCSFVLVQVCLLVECGSAKIAGEDMICGEMLLTGNLCSEKLSAFIALKIVHRECQVRVASSSVSEDSSAFGTLVLVNCVFVLVQRSFCPEYAVTIIAAVIMNSIIMLV